MAITSDRYCQHDNYQRVIDLPGNSTRSVELGYWISPLGDTVSSLVAGAGPRRADVFYFDLYLIPSPRWSGGRVRVEIKIAWNLLKVRHKRIVIKRRVSAIKRSQSEAINSSSG
jgi:hypothetical protein